MPYLGNYLWYTGDAQNIFDLIQSIGTHDLGQQQPMMEPTCPSSINLQRELVVENNVVKLTIRDPWKTILKHELFV